MDQRFIELVEKVAIRELNARYFWAVDTNDLQSYLELWDVNGISLAEYGSATGHKELRTRFVDMQKGISKNKRHVVSNLEVDLKGEVAYQRCYLTVFEREGEPTVLATATYADKLIKTPNGWKFTRRKITIDSRVDNWGNYSG